MIGEFKRFEVGRRPARQWHILRPLTWLLSFPAVWAHRAEIDKTGMPPRLKPPYFLLCNHNAFMDFKIMTRAIFPHRANYVVAVDGFMKREWLLRAVGCIGNRKFVRSISLVRNMLTACSNGDIVVLFPEARYSLCGTFSILPPSLGKMVRKMNVPVVTLIMNGHHINSPYWNTKNRKIKPVESKMQLLFTAEETQTLTIDELNAGLNETFDYDDFKWQKDNKVRVKFKNRAEGLHKVLYQCPSCLAEFRMSSQGSSLSCDECSKTWDMSEYGELSACAGSTEFPHIPDWYEWQRSNVRKEVQSGTYNWSGEVRIESLPNAKGFVVFPEAGRLTHGVNGFTLTGVYKDEAFELHWNVSSLYSCHIEYDYMGRGDCIDLNTEHDTFYLFPDGKDYAVTKLSLATEELYVSKTQEEPINV